MRYYKPTPNELLNTPDLILEMYEQENGSWTEFTYDCTAHMGIDLDDLRIRYLDSTDFNVIGYLTKKIWLRKVEVITDILEDGTEVTKEVDVHEEDRLIVLNDKGLAVGFFYPFEPKRNVKIAGVFHSVRNGTELKEILR